MRPYNLVLNRSRDNYVEINCKTSENEVQDLKTISRFYGDKDTYYAVNEKTITADDNNKLPTLPEGCPERT